MLRKSTLYLSAKTRTYLSCCASTSAWIAGTGEKEELKKTFMESEAIKKQLGRSDVCHNMLFIHSVLGCDTTSLFYEIGKATASEKYTNSSTLEGKRRSSTCISPWMMYC